MAAQDEQLTTVEPAQQGRLRGAPLVRLGSTLPELIDAVPAEEREIARRVLVAPMLTGCDEDLAELLRSARRAAFDFLVLDGVVLKETMLSSRPALEILGPGDVLAPPLSAIRQIEARAVSRYLAHGHVTLAALDERFRQAARRWPGLSDVLHDALGRQTHRASMQLAVMHQPRVEDRILGVFADLGERFGRVTADGVLVDAPLTHEIIGRLVGSRRPTVTLALAALDADGVLRRLEGDRWALAASALAP